MYEGEEMMSYRGVCDKCGAKIMIEGTRHNSGETYSYELEYFCNNCNNFYSWTDNGYYE